MFAILTSGLLAVSLASGIGVGAGFAVGTAAGAALTEGVEDAPVFVPALGEALGVALAEGLVVTVAKGVNVCKGISDGSDVIFVSGEGESLRLPCDQKSPFFTNRAFCDNIRKLIAEWYSETELHQMIVITFYIVYRR